MKKLKFSLLGFILILTGTIAAAAGVSAESDEQLRLVNEGETVIDPESHAWNTVAYDQYKAATYGDYQYTAYWDNQHQLNLGRRNLETDEVDTITFPDKISTPSNTHLNVVVGISPADGRVHIAYNHHGAFKVNYRVSEANFITEPPENISIDDFSDNQNILQENYITYPRFFNDKDGQLYFMFRQGSSGSGDQYLYKYDISSEWTKTGLVFSGSGNWNGSTSRNAYLQNLVFDDNNRLHASWVYREEAYSHSTNHGLYYAYSDDEGVTWHNDEGLEIADLTNNDSIKVDDPGIQVIDIPQNTWVLNQAAMTLDSKGQPHLLMSRSETVTSNVPDTNVHYIHYWKTEDGWHEQYIVDTKNAVGHGAHWTEIFNYRGDIAIDENDNIFVTLPMPNNTLYAAQANGEDWSNWSVYALTGPGVTYAGQKYDRQRWENEKVLSIPMTVVKGDKTQYIVRDYKFTEPLLPDTPSLQKLTYGTYSVDLNWHDTAGAEHYEIHRSEDGTNFDELIAVSASEFGVYEDNTVDYGKIYTYKITAINSKGESGFSNELSVETYERKNIAAGKSITASSITSSYPASLAIDGNAGTFWVSANKVGLTPQNPEWLTVDLKEKTAVDRIGIQGRVVGDERIFQPKDIEIQTSDDGENFTSQKTVTLPLGKDIHQVSFNEVETKYLRLVILSAYAKDPNGNVIDPATNAQLAELEIYQAIDKRIPAPPNNLTAAVGTKQNENVITWEDRSSNEDSFLLERRTESGSWEEVASVPANTTVFSDSKIESGYYYSYRVSAFNEYGQKYSNTASILAQDIYNLALNKSVKASSEQQGNGASNLVDGNLNTRWSAQNYPQSVEVDLGQVYSINKTEIASYLKRAYQYTIEISVDGINYKQIVDKKSNTVGEPLTKDEFSAIDARYVKLTITGAHEYTGGWASLTEIRVFEAPPYLEQVDLHTDSRNVLPGEQVELEVTGILNNGEEADLSKAAIVFETSHPEFITVSEDGTMAVADFVKDLRSFEVWTTVVLAETKVKSEAITFTIQPTIAHTIHLLEDYVDSGDVNGPLVSQLTNSLKQVEHHEEKEHKEQTIHHLNNFLKHINNKEMENHINKDSSSVLVADVERLIELLKE